MFAPAYMGEKRCFSNAFSPHAMALACTTAFYSLNQSVGRASPVFFGPCTLERTWGTRPGKLASLFVQGRSQL
jgi:hypothetical protein